jgi:autotransporter translocation and assembly factor TamB
MAVKRGGRILPLVLGVVLAVFSLAVLAVVVAAQIEPVEIKYIKYGEVTTARLRA